MAKKVLGIEISNSLIRMVEMDYQKKNPTVYRNAVVPTPPGAIKDGYLQGSTALRDVIRSALLEYKMNRTKDVIFTVASSKIVTREVVLPPVKPNMIENLIKSNLNEYFPIDLSSYDVAHLVLEQFAEGPDKGKYRTMIMAADKSLVSSYDELATMCGLRLVSLDYAGNSIFQSIRRENTANRVMVLKIEEGQTTVSVIKNKNLMLQRSVNYGLNEAINEVVNQPVFAVNTEDEAWELLKRKTCIKFNVSENAQRNSMNRDLSTDIETRDFDESQEVREAKIAVTRSMETFIGSIRRVVEFYASRNAGEEVDLILITGSGGAMSGLAKLFTNELGIQTAVINRLEGVSYHVTSEDAGIFNFVSCIGATFNPVGFISKEKKAKQKKDADFTPITILLIIVVFLVCIIMYVVSKNNYNEQLEEEERLKKLEQDYKKAEQTFIAYTNLQNFNQQVKNGVNATKRPNDNILKLIEELELNLPSDVEITQFTSDDVAVVMTMNVANKEVAAGVIANLREFKSIMNVSIPGIDDGTGNQVYVAEEDASGTTSKKENTSGEEEEGRVYFTVTATYYPGGSSRE